jgi:N-acetylglutamate synthase-like GNAT family acetyltransferase
MLHHHKLDEELRHFARLIGLLDLGHSLLASAGFAVWKSSMSESSLEISTDPARLDVTLIHEFLRASYWAKHIPREVVERSIEHSLCFGAYRDGKQVGFARAVTDRATFAYIGDVFVVSEERGRGVSKAIMAALRAHPDLQGLRRLFLATRDAHGLYAQFGFEPLKNPDWFMSVHDPLVYQRAREH